MTFYYDHRTHLVTSSAQGPLYTTSGTFQSELGCGADNDATCMRPWLTDADGDGVFTWASTEVPAGSYAFSVVKDFTVPASASTPLEVPAAGMLVTITYNPATGQVSTSTRQATVVPDLSRVGAHFVTSDLIAYPRASLAAGVDPTNRTWKLHWTTSGTLSLDAEDVVGGESALLTLETAGWSPAQLAARPALADHLALRVDKKTAQQVGNKPVPAIAVSQHDRLGALVDATGADKAWCTRCKR